MDGQQIWADLFGPPFDRYGERILLGALVGGSLLGGVIVGIAQLDWLLAGGAGVAGTLAAGSMMGAMVGLPLVAVSARVARHRGWRVQAIFGAAMLAAALMFGLWFAGTLLRRNPVGYGPQDTGATYERTWRRGNEVVRTETIAGSQLSAEEWVKDASMVAAGASSFAILAAVPLVLGLARSGRWERESAPVRPPEDEPWLVRTLGGRCAVCSRLVLRRWRRCPSCSTLLPAAYAGRRELDAAIDQLSVIGLLASGFGLIACAVLAIGDSRTAAWVVGSATVVFGLSHVALALTEHMLRPVQVLWTVLAMVPVVTLWGNPRIAVATAAVPAAVALWLLIEAPRLLGRPPERRLNPAVERLYGYRCSVCGSSDTRIVAPIYVVSVVVATVKRHGSPDVLCAWHARLWALPATLVSALMGWWGIPWGLLWTPGALIHNVLDGGQELDRSAALDMVDDAQEGPHAVRATSLLVAVATAFVAALALLLLTAPPRP